MLRWVLVPVCCLLSIGCATGGGGPAGDGAAGGRIGADSGGGGAEPSAGGARIPAGAAGGAQTPIGGAGGAREAGGSPGGAAGAGGASGSPSDAGGGSNPDASVPDAGPRGDARVAGTGPSRPVTNAPTYVGSVDNSAACSREYATTGFEPDREDAATYPLFLYFVGTRFVATDASATYTSAAAAAVTEAMARRGFVALSVEYDNSVAAWLDPTQENQLRCLFDAAAPDNLLTAACALPQVDCDQGIAAWGHSQGAFVSHVAFNYDDRVRAVWTTGYGGNAASRLDPTRLRVVNGEADAPPNGTVAGLNDIAGFTLADCPEGTSECLRSDGSGWILVRRADLADPAASSADHCWFDKANCLDGTVRLEPNWIDPGSTKAFALESNADWVAATVGR